jgi:hypothetical protein
MILSVVATNIKMQWTTRFPQSETDHRFIHRYWMIAIALLAMMSLRK